MSWQKATDLLYQSTGPPHDVVLAQRSKLYRNWDDNDLCFGGIQSSRQKFRVIVLVRGVWRRLWGRFEILRSEEMHDALKHR